MKIQMQIIKPIGPIVDAKKTKSVRDYEGSEVSGLLNRWVKTST